MKLSDALKGRDYKEIEYRIMLPEGLGTGDAHYGKCQYINGELKSLDGDSYSLDDEIIRFEETGPDAEISGGATLTVYISWDTKKMER